MIPVLLDTAARLTGVALVVTAAELAVVEREFTAFDVPPVRARRYASPVRIIGCGLPGVALIVAPATAAAAVASVVAAVSLIAVVRRIRPAADGADAMLVWLCILWALHLLIPRTTGLMPVAWAVVVVVSVAAAYAGSGVAKVRVPAWRSGRMIALVVNSRQYGNARLAAVLLDASTVPRVLSWSVMIAEVGYAVAAAVSGLVLIVWTACLLAMHASIRVLMGLARYGWVCGAARLLVAGAR